MVPNSIFFPEADSNTDSVPNFWPWVSTLQLNTSATSWKGEHFMSSLITSLSHMHSPLDKSANLILFLNLLQTFATSKGSTTLQLMLSPGLPSSKKTSHQLSIFTLSQQLKQKNTNSHCSCLANLNVISPLNLFLFYCWHHYHLWRVYWKTLFSFVAWCLTSSIHCHSLASDQHAVLFQLVLCGPTSTRMSLTGAVLANSANALKYTVTQPHHFPPLQALIIYLIMFMLILLVHFLGQRDLHTSTHMCWQIYSLARGHSTQSLQKKAAKLLSIVEFPGLACHPPSQLIMAVSSSRPCGNNCYNCSVLLA